jgi:metallo-beta-lactamase family protein
MRGFIIPQRQQSRNAKRVKARCEIKSRFAHRNACQPKATSATLAPHSTTQTIMAIKLTFHGAAGTVTGSAYHLQTSRASVLIDFGMFQGFSHHEEQNIVPRTLDVTKLDAVLLTHAHLDHTGRLPLLAKQDFRAPIYCTEATIPLSGLILRDSAHLQAMDAERVNRKRQRAGEAPLEPLYTAEHVEKILPQFKAVPYDQATEVAPGIRARWVEAGHMLGSASLQLCVQDGGATKTIVFSGDVGPKGAPILQDAVGFEKADVVVMESTYGDRDNKVLSETVAEFESIVKAAVARKSKILVPVFAVGRTQLLLYLLAQMFRQKAVPKFPIFLDSPMAVEATKIYWENLDLFDDEFKALNRERPLTEDLNTLKATPTAQDSMALNDLAGPCLIMAGSGMCNGGRILHHLKQNLWREGTCVLIVGYQGEGSLGRRLVDGHKEVSIFGEKIAVKASVHTLNGFSAHAGQTELLRWFGQMADCHPRTFLTHGEERGRQPLAEKLAARYQKKRYCQNSGTLLNCDGTVR